MQGHQQQASNHLVTKAIPRVAISQSELFLDWPAEEREKLIAASDYVSLGEGAILHKPGDPADYLYLVATGSMRISTHPAPGRDFTIRLCFPGDYHGIGPVISEVPCVYTVTCREETHLVRIPSPVLLDTLRRNGRLAIAMFAALNKRHRRAVGLYADAATHPLRSRIATVLEMLIARGDSRGSVELFVLQNELAEMLGSRRQVVNRELRVMETDGILRLEYGRISITNRTLLQTLASFMPGLDLID